MDLEFSVDLPSIFALADIPAKRAVSCSKGKSSQVNILLSWGRTTGPGPGLQSHDLL